MKTTRRLCSAVLSALAAVLSCAPTAVAVPDPVATAVHDAFAPLLQAHDVPGLAVAVIADGVPTFFNFGVASKESGAPVTENTLFEIGSLSKTFTATLATTAENAGALSLTAHPGHYLPELRGTPVDAARLVDLGTYSAGGLPLQFPETVRSDADMLAYFRQWQPASPPGRIREYSNPSIGLFGHLAASAMGRPFVELVQGDLLPRLGLRKTFIDVPQSAMPAYAWGYDKTGRAVHVNPGVFDAEAYGVKSSAADMARFLSVNLRPEQVDPSLAAGVRGTHVGRFAVGPMVQGLGWEQYRYPAALDTLLQGNSTEMATQPQPVTPLAAPLASALFNKTGSTDGFGAYAAFVPTEQIGVVMLANRNFPISARVTAAHAVLEALAARP